MLGLFLCSVLIALHVYVSSRVSCIYTYGDVVLMVFEVELVVYCLCFKMTNAYYVFHVLSFWVGREKRPHETKTHTNKNNQRRMLEVFLVLILIDKTDTMPTRQKKQKLGNPKQHNTKLKTNVSETTGRA